MDLQQEFSDIDKDDSLWITSYADLISALLAVLILMASFSKIDVEAFDAVQRVQNDEQVETLSEMYQRIQRIAEENGVSDQVNLTLSRHGLEINFNSVMLFRSASAVLNHKEINRVDPVLSAIAEAGSDRFIDIIGHTDDVPFSMRNESNWNLSADRAAALHKYFLSRGMPEDGSRLIAYADTQPLVSIQEKAGSDLEEARSLNRRVSVLIGLLKRR